MAVYTHTHIERLHLSNFFHLSYVAMTLRTIYPTVDVSGVIKINKIRLIMDFGPLNWLVFIVLSIDPFDVLFLSRYSAQSMAVVACGRRRNRRVSGLLNSNEAILACDLVVPCVDLVIEGDWLIW